MFANRQTRRKADMLITILCSTIAAKYITQTVNSSEHEKLCCCRPGVSNMQPAGENPARKAFISGLLILAEFVKIDGQLNCNNYQVCRWSTIEEHKNNLLQQFLSEPLCNNFLSSRCHTMGRSPISVYLQ